MSVWSERSTGRKGPVSLRGPLWQLSSSAATLCLECGNAQGSVQKCLWAEVKSSRKGWVSSCRALFTGLNCHSTGSLQMQLFELWEVKVQQTAQGQTLCSRALIFSSSQAMRFLLEELHQGDCAWETTRNAHVPYSGSTGTEPQSTAITNMMDKHLPKEVPVVRI